MGRSRLTRRAAFDAIYPDLLRLASRSHTYGQIRGGRRSCDSSPILGLHLWDGPDPIADPEPLLTVAAHPGAWWHNCYLQPWASKE